MEKKDNYVVRRSEFSRLKDWAIEAIGNDADFGWFVMQFQSCFGRSAAYNPKTPIEDFEGFFMRYQKIADKMTEAGYEVSLPTIKRYMPRMADMGILSRAKVTEHPRSKIIYVLNYETAFENNALAEKIAAREREVSPYKDQADNSAKKKAREAAGESVTLTVARNIARELTEDNTIKKFLIDYLQTSDATAKGAWTAVEGCKRYGKRITLGVFNNALNEYGVVFTREQEARITEMRDALNKARQMDRQPVQEAPVSTPQIESKAPNKTSWVKSPEQLKLEEQMRKDDILAEKERIAAQEQALKNDEFEKMLADIL
jgi:hypothetical protein